MCLEEAPGEHWVGLEEAPGEHWVDLEEAPGEHWVGLEEALGEHWVGLEEAPGEHRVGLKVMVHLEGNGHLQVGWWRHLSEENSGSMSTAPHPTPSAT